MKNRKARNQSVTVRFDEPTTLNCVKIHHDGQIEFLRDDKPAQPAEVNVELRYDRPKGLEAALVGHHTRIRHSAMLIGSTGWTRIVARLTDNGFTPRQSFSANLPTHSTRRT